MNKYFIFFILLISLSFLLYNYKENKKSYFVDYIKNATFDGKLLNYKNIYVGSFEDQKKIDELKLSSNDIDFDTLKNKFTDSIDEVGRPMNIENIIVKDTLLVNDHFNVGSSTSNQIKVDIPLLRRIKYPPYHFDKDDKKDPGKMCLQDSIGKECIDKNQVHVINGNHPFYLTHNVVSKNNYWDLSDTDNQKTKKNVYIC